MLTDALTPLRRWAIRVGLVAIGVVAGLLAGHVATGALVGVLAALVFDAAATVGTAVARRGEASAHDPPGPERPDR